MSPGHASLRNFVFGSISVEKNEDMKWKVPWWQENKVSVHLSALKNVLLLFHRSAGLKHAMHLPPAEQQELASSSGSDGTAADSSWSRIRQGRPSGVSHHRLSAGRMPAVSLQPSISLSSRHSSAVFLWAGEMNEAKAHVVLPSNAITS